MIFKINSEENKRRWFMFYARDGYPGRSGKYKSIAPDFIVRGYLLDLLFFHIGLSARRGHLLKFPDNSIIKRTVYFIKS